MQLHTKSTQKVEMSELMVDSELLKERLRNWADRNGIRPADFAKKMGYSYNHAFQLLRGNADVTPEMIGRLVLAYGPQAAAEITQTPGENE